ncbi:MAG TPA: hypothetical protein VM141_11625 [Planctomycetota bacterium]|nr:hypothetical protein [Planctomycetota bacterium]
MDEEQQREFLDNHIPYRITAVDFMGHACDLVTSGRADRPAVVVIDGQKELEASKCRFLTNPVIETGAIFCRVLLEFLGVKLGKDMQLVSRCSNKKNGEPNKKNDDVFIEDFRLNGCPLTRVSPETILSTRGFGSEEAIKRACITAIHVPNKAVAHLTSGLEERDTLEDLRLCSKLIPYLVAKHLYEALEYPVPPYGVKRIGNDNQR